MFFKERCPHCICSFNVAINVFCINVFFTENFIQKMIFELNECDND